MVLPWDDDPPVGTVFFEQGEWEDGCQCAKQPTLSGYCIREIIPYGCRVHAVGLYLDRLVARFEAGPETVALFRLDGNRLCLRVDAKTTTGAREQLERFYLAAIDVMEVK